MFNLGINLSTLMFRFTEKNSFIFFTELIQRNLSSEDLVSRKRFSYSHDLVYNINLIEGILSII